MLDQCAVPLLDIELVVLQVVEASPRTVGARVLDSGEVVPPAALGQYVLVDVVKSEGLWEE